MSSTYSDLLKHPFWQRKRLSIMQRDNFKCIDCHASEITLNVHHKTYLPNRKPWEYDDDNFETLCEKCHEKRHLKYLSVRTNIQTIGEVIEQFSPGSYLDKMKRDALLSNIQSTDINYDTVRDFWVRFVTKLTLDNETDLVDAFVLCRRNLIDNNSISITPIDNCHLPIIEKNLSIVSDYAEEYFKRPIQIKITANEDKKEIA